MTALTHTLPAEAGAEDDIKKSAYSKVTWRFVPFLMLCYVVAYLDRVNVGFAKLQMSTDLGFSETAYGLGAGIFFLGYFLFEVPSNVILHKVGARIWIARIMVTWGLISAGFMFVATAPMFYRAALPARRRRSRLLSRDHPLSHLLVSFAPPRQDHRDLHVGDPDLRHLRQPAFRLDHGLVPRRQRPRRLAVDVPHRGSPCDPARCRGLFLPRQWHPPCQVAERRGEAGPRAARSPRKTAARSTLTRSPAFSAIAGFG